MDDPQIGSMIDAIWLLRQRKRKLNDEMKEINKNSEKLESELIQLMEDHGISKADGNKASFSFAYKQYPAVKDKEAFYRWVVEGEHFDFVQNRVNQAPFDAYYEQFMAHPDGLEAFTKAKANLRTK